MKSRSLRKEIIYLNLRNLIHIVLFILPFILTILMFIKPKFMIFRILSKVATFNSFIIPVFIVINILFNIYYYKHIKIKLYGIKGEYKVFKQLKIIKKSGYKTFQNVHLKNKELKAQLDFIVVGKTGIFIVEVKNQRGIITGNSESKYLTKVKRSKSGNEYNKKIYNPIKQVNTHIYKLSKILREDGVNIWIKGVVLFTNKDSIVKVDSDKILIIQSENCDKLINVIKNNNDIVISRNDIEKISKIINKNMY
jgi:hypothetical protein